MPVTVSSERLLLTGEPISAQEAQRLGLVVEVAEDRESAARRFVDENLRPKSAAATARALRAARAAQRPLIAEALRDLARFCLDDLMKTRDAGEGIAAFLEKREPRWEDR